MVEAEHHQSISVGENTIIQWQALPSLINPLVIHHRMPGCFANDILKSYDGQMEQLQRSCNSLEKHPLRPLGLLIKRPSSSPHLCHRREAIVHLGQISV